jgi:GDP-L-fucose synthase
VIHLAGLVGGIGFNRENQGRIFYDNLIMGTELMEAARKANVEKFVSIGTICSYPKTLPTPFKEENLWNGYPEETNAPYGLAKKMLIVQSKAYHEQYKFNSINLLPVNLYGPGEHYEENRSHVIPALIRKFFEAKMFDLPVVEIWGTGKATREFLYVEDAAEAIILATERLDRPEPINLGSGHEISIENLAKKIKKKVGYNGQIFWDKTKPDGQPKRILDSSKAFRLFGFKAKTNFEEGLEKTIDWYKNAYIKIDFSDFQKNNQLHNRKQ